MVNETLCWMLEEVGYTVESARDGDEAIWLYKKSLGSSSPFDAVVLDLTVRGGMGGKDAIVKLLEIDPNIKAIASSGYSNDPIISDCRQYGFKDAIAKPYDIKRLSDMIKRIIKSGL